MKHRLFRLIIIILLFIIIGLIIIFRNKPVSKTITENKTIPKETTDVITKTETVVNKTSIPEKKIDSITTSNHDQTPKNSLTSTNDNKIAEQTPVKITNPLDTALANGKLTLVDFGSGTCIPCKQMKPIIEELAKEYQEKVNVFLFDIKEYEELTRKYKIQIIPTQIFFDKKGNEYWRHEGFIPKSDIVKKLIEIGI